MSGFCQNSQLSLDNVFAIYTFTCMAVTSPCTSADPEGGQGVRTPSGKSQVIWVSIGNKQLDPPPWKKLDPPPPGKCWTPSGTLEMIVFFEIKHLTSEK